MPLIFFFVFTGCENDKVLSRPVRILPLGDSITQADTRHPSYRYHLWEKLRREGYDIDFVGSQRNNFRGANPRAEFDHDHEGHWGWSAAQFVRGVPGRGSLQEFLGLSSPDIALVHLGSNDVFRGAETAEITDDLAAIIEMLRSGNEDIIILLAQIIPVAHIEGNLHIVKLNRAIAEMPHRLGLPDTVIIVDHFSGFDPAADTYDGVHPNEQGEEKMAEAWHRELKKVLPAT